MANITQLLETFQAHPALMAECQPCFSQNGEDVVVNVILDEEAAAHGRGMFVDFGAYHPFRFSNTFLLYLKGWRGVNVDANPDAIAAFQSIRSEDVSVRALMSDKAEELEFRRYAEGAFNTANPASMEIMASRTNAVSKLLAVDRLTTTTPNQIFDAHVGSKKLDFVNIDVEGLDERLLYAIDFDRYRPKVLAVEMLLQQWTSEPMRSFLSAKGYAPHSHCFHTAIFVRK